MRRREFITLIGGNALLRPLVAQAEAGRSYRVGGVTASPRDAPIIVAMFDELRRAGFVEGRNLTIDWRTYGANADLIPELAADLVKANVDVIYAAGDPAIRSAQGATRTIPILGITEDMIAAGLVSSLARPSGNTTGLSVLATQLDGKRQEILLEAVQSRLDKNPQAMRQRRETVEHPFGTLKMRMGATHFLMKRLPKVATEMALHVLAYNLTRVMNIMGTEPLIAAIRA